MSEHVVQVISRFDFQLNPEIIGKAFYQLVLKAGFAVAIFKIGGRTVTGDDPQYPILLYALECAGFFNAGTKHQEESGGEQPFGATRADCSE